MRTGRASSLNVSVMSGLRVRYVTGSRLLADALGRRLAEEPDLALADDGPPPDVLVVEAAGTMLSAGADRSATPTRLVVLATSDAPGGAVAAARAGASAWLDHRSGADDLLRVLRGVARGGAFFPRGVQAEILASLRTDAEVGEPSDPLSRLTGRERDVLHALADGLGNREVGEYLGMSYNTVRTHTNEIFRKLGVHTRVDAVRALRGAR
jgi:two-component system, NarL family, response regulator LiaR